MILEVSNIDIAYGPTAAVVGVSFSLGRGMITVLIGANGAGKSTVLRGISGTITEYGGRRSGGNILLNGENVNALRSDQLVAKGMVMVPDGRRLFKRMSVDENLRMGAFAVRNKTSVSEGYDRVLSLFPELKGLLSRKSGSLSGGEQQMVALGRALMSQPKVLLVDEPSLGLAPRLLQDVFGKLAQLRDQEGIGIVVVEQNVREAMEIADRVVGLRRGKVVLNEQPSQISDQELRDLFLG